MTAIEAARAELIGTKDRLLTLLAETPDDKLGWKPTPSGRSILEIAAHCGHALENIRKQLEGAPFAIPTSAEANKVFLEHDSTFNDRAQVVEYVESSCAAYMAFLDTLEPVDLERMVTLPFGLGEAPMGYFMTMGNAHTSGHIPQIEYIQTLYADHDWHTGF